ncbi:hypothetical protein JOD54_004819 [Actinokineospora baliensis]|uniref:hypothetical protein n=1 Tax=Actinokineospora baliensis TaxID=547056 RepID=UPI0019578782|nr:hypothetical protein [Actinokineospora baliensis]MBM7774615.1 hypothetical protein [Actinokineospora baliensis]
MTQSVDQQIVRAFALEIITRVAPAEQHTFGPQSDAYFADPQRALAGKEPTRGDRLGSGLTDFLDTVVPVVTPIALAVATDLISRSLQDNAGPGLKRIGTAVGKLLGRGRSTPTEPVVDVPLPDRSDAWRAIHDLALQHGKDESLARRIADAITGEER